MRPTVPTLATLAYDPRRGAMFRSELFNALEILNRGDIELERLKGSWAGALGQPQFMPSSYLRYAQDFDGDGRRDIWRRRPTCSPRSPTTCSSTAGRRARRGAARWSCRPAARSGGRRAAPRRGLPRAPRHVDPAAARRVAQARRAHDRKQPLPRRRPHGLARPRRHARFLVYANYEALLDYNCAHTYALSVALLADRIF